MVKQNKPQRNVVGISESEESDDGQASPARQSHDEHITEHPAKRARRHSSDEGKKRTSVDVQVNQGEQAEAETAYTPEAAVTTASAAAADAMDVDEPQQQTTAHPVDPVDHTGLAAQDSGCVLGNVFPGTTAAADQVPGEGAADTTAAVEAAPAGGGLKQRHSSRQHKQPERLAPDSGRLLSRQLSSKPPEKFKEGDEAKVQAEARTIWQGADKNWGKGAPKLPADAKNPAVIPEGDEAAGWGFWMKFNDNDKAVWYRGKVYWHSAKSRKYWLCMEDGDFIYDQGVAATVEECRKGDFIFCRPPVGQFETAAAAVEEEQQQPVSAQAAKHKKQAEHKRKHELDQQQQQQAQQAEEAKAAKPVTGPAVVNEEVLLGDAAAPFNPKLEAKVDGAQTSGELHKQQQQPASGQKNKGQGRKQHIARKSGLGTKSGGRRPGSAAAAATAIPGSPSHGAAAAAAPGGAMRPASASMRPQQQWQRQLSGLERPAQELATCLLRLREGAQKVQNGLKQQVEALEQLTKADIDIKQADLKDITQQIKIHMDAQQQKQGTSLCAVPGHLAVTGLPKAGAQLLEKVQTLSASLWAAMSGRSGAAAAQHQQRRPSSGVGDVHSKQQQPKQPPGTPSKQQQRKLPGTPGKLGLGIKQEGDKAAAAAVAAGEASLLDAHAGTGFAALGALGKRGRDGMLKADPADAAGVSPSGEGAEPQVDTAAAALAAPLGPDEKLVQRFLDLVPLQPLDDPLRETAVALLSAVLQPPVAVSPFTVAHEIEQKLHVQHGIIGTGKHLYLRHLYMIWCVLGGKELMVAAEAAEQAKSAATAAALQAQQAAGGDGEPQGAADAKSAAARAAQQAEAADAAVRAALEGLPGVADAAAVRSALLSGLATVDEVVGMTNKMLGFDHQRDR